MSFSIPLDSVADIQEIIDKCTITPKVDIYNPNPEPTKLYKFDHHRKRIVLPYSLWRDLNVDPLNERGSFDERDMDYTGAPLYTKNTDPKKRRDQDVVFRYVKRCMKKGNSCLVAAHTGFGKTKIGTVIACKSKLKTLIVAHNRKVRDQWIENFKKDTTCTVSKWDKNSENDSDVVVVGTMTCEKLTEKELRSFGMILVDEVHMCTRSLHECLLKVRPRYLIGFSATPDRVDGLEQGFPLFFSRTIHRQEVKPFTIVKIETDFRPEIRYTTVNKKKVMDWTHAINTLAYNKDRQRMCAKTVHEYMNSIANVGDTKVTQSNENMSQVDDVASPLKLKPLLLSSRKLECQAVRELMEERGYAVGTVDKNTKCDLLISGFKKGGVGFDDSSLTMAAFLDDQKDARQFEGRIRCDGNLILDFVDNHPTFEKHWEKRKEWYVSRGATIKVVARTTTNSVQDKHFQKKRSVVEEMNSLPRMVRKIKA